MFISQLTVFFLMLIIFPKYLQVFRESGFKTDLKLAREPIKSSRKLFTKIGEEIDIEGFIYKIVGYKVESPCYLENIRLFKKEIENFVGEEIGDYYLLRDSIKIKLDSGFINFIAGASRTVMISIITLLISSIFITKLIDILNSGTTTIEVLTLIIQCLNFIVFSLVIIYMFFLSTSSNNNRARLLLSVVEIIINDKEKYQK